MRILAIGDITDSQTADYVASVLWDVRRKNGIDFAVVNAENASFISGASPEQAEKLLLGGADVITGGNHTMQVKSYHEYLENSKRAIRPVNYPPNVPGAGYTVLDCLGYRVLVINAMGRIGIEPALDNPFVAVERVLTRESGKYDFAILDFHAEATGEKNAMPHIFDGRISVIFGTHTHVQTADERIFPKGTAYITDIGMCGHSGGILGIDAGCIVSRMLTSLPAKYVEAQGKIEAEGVIFELDENFRGKKIERIKF